MLKMLTNKNDKVKGKLCWKSELENPFGGIELRQAGKDNFTVRYGLQTDQDLNYGQAAAKLGQAIMHHLACEGLLDNREKGER